MRGGRPPARRFWSLSTVCQSMKKNHYSLPFKLIHQSVSRSLLCLVLSLTPSPCLFSLSVLSLSLSISPSVPLSLTVCPPSLSRCCLSSFMLVKKQKRFVSWNIVQNRREKSKDINRGEDVKYHERKRERVRKERERRKHKTDLE